MSLSIGGAIVKEMTLTHAWGLSPASASIEAVGGTVFASDSEISLSLGGFTFNGIITDCRERRDDNGTSLSITATDNRIKLQDDTIFGFFNGVEIVEDDPTTPGVDRKKRYFHIYPDDWLIQKKTYTQVPLSAEEVLDLVFNSETVFVGWNPIYTSQFQKPVYGLDANNGKKLGTFVQEVCDALNVQMTLNGSHSLSFSVKGDGFAPNPPAGSSSEISEGNARGPYPTRIRIVGDRNLYQDINIELEKDWSAHFEQFWFKPAWVAHVMDQFGISDRATGEARAREITLREYSAQVGGTDVEDFGIWGEVSRMEIPVWIYIDDIVFKAFRVPSNYTLNDLPITSLEIRDGLLCSVEAGLSGSMNYKTSELYPDAKSYCIVQGQPISLYDPKTREGITPAQFAAARSLWREVNRFNLDTKNKVIIFEEALFVDSSSNALFKQPNVNATGLDNETKNLVVPNAAAVITGARVKASLCFEAEKFAQWYGSGVRSDGRYVRGINYHTLSSSGVLVQELLYDNGKTADQLAAEVAAAALTGQDFIQSGGFTRHGSAGTFLNGAIDRVTVSLRFESGGAGEGLSEHVEYAKERSPVNFESGRELERRQATKELFPGQKNLEQEVAATRLLGRLLKEGKRQSERGFENLDAVTTRLPGNRDCGATYAFGNGTTGVEVGTIIFVGPDNAVDPSSKRFAGVVSAAGVSNVQGYKIPLATQGLVPALVKGPFKTDDVVGANDNEGFASKDGAKKFGVIQSPDYTGTETILAMVRVGKGGADSQGHPFKVTKGEATEAGGAKVLIQPGTVVGVIPNISGILLDNTPPPTLSFTQDGMVLLRVDIDGVSEDFRPLISELTVKKQNGVTINDDDDDPLGELKMVWDDVVLKTAGYFYIKVAGIKCVLPALPAPQIPSITQIDQYLEKVIYSFVIVVDDVIIFS